MAVVIAPKIELSRSIQSLVRIPQEEARSGISIACLVDPESNPSAPIQNELRGWDMASLRNCREAD
jgi:hypothetical protein